jgi:hypothetical protein
MATITTRDIKGSALTHTEVDDNFINLNSNKIELANLSATTSGDGNLTYNANTGAFIYTGPGNTQYRAAFSAGNGISISSGVISSTITDSNTRYTLNTFTGNGNVVITLASDDFSANSSVSLVQGTNITITRSDNNITINSTSSGLANIQQDTNPTLGGNLNTNGFNILGSGSNVSSIVMANSSINLIAGGTSGIVKSNKFTYSENISNLGNVSGTISLDVTNVNIFTMTLTGNITINGFSGGNIAGASATLIISTNGTNRTLTSTMKFADGDNTLSDTDTIDVMSIFFDGTNYLASINKDFN